MISFIVSGFEFSARFCAYVVVMRQKKRRRRTQTRTSSSSASSPSCLCLVWLVLSVSMYYFVRIESCIILALSGVLPRGALCIIENVCTRLVYMYNKTSRVSRACTCECSLHSYYVSITRGTGECTWKHDAVFFSLLQTFKENVDMSS